MVLSPKKQTLTPTNINEFTVLPTSSENLQQILVFNNYITMQKKKKKSCEQKNI